jgi:hypothetical protein
MSRAFSLAELWTTFGPEHNDRDERLTSQLEVAVTDTTLVGFLFNPDAHASLAGSHDGYGG